jgi:SAM-dependent methyltransferase
MAINDRKRAAIEFSLCWESSGAAHNDRLFIEKIDFWRDIFPGSMGEALADSAADRSQSESFVPGRLVPEYTEKNIVSFKKSQLVSASIKEKSDLEQGRFYPKGYFWKPLQSFPADLTPVRLARVDDRSMTVDANHPLSRYPLTVTAQVQTISSIAAQRGGSLHDIAEEITANGPGMQASEHQAVAGSRAGQPLARDDESDDAAYYSTPRLVHHLDNRARAHVRSLYGRLLEPQSRVLDLMSSWESHLPDSLDSCTVEGLGMNEQELQANRKLSSRLIHDLNRTPALPYPENSFDAAVCTVSFEYLCRPSEVIADLARVIKPGGLLVITISERWFPGKQVHGWAELHPFERQGLIVNYLLGQRFFEHIRTESIRGYPRPADDKYADRLSTSDSLYFVWGSCR